MQWKPVDTKVTLHHIRKILLLNIKIKFKIWRVTFLKSFFLPLKKFGMYFRFSRKRDFTMCATEMRQSLVYSAAGKNYVISV